MTRPNLYMLCGVPGAGKSTFLSPLDNYDFKYCLASTDFFIDLAAKLRGKTYNEVFHDTIKDANKAMYEIVMAAVKDDMHIIWDQTNLNRKSRAGKLIMVPDHYRKVAVVFPTPERKELERRLASRPGKIIPMSVMKNMIDSFQYPAIDEGFDKIITPEEFINEELRNLQVA